ncbi:MAG: phage baseplate assembly protein V [Pseudomonadota bacterium]
MYLSPLTDPRAASGLGGQFYGVYPATVVDLADPEGQGRVRVRLPLSPDPGDDGFEAWARIASFMAGADRGAWFQPDVDDEVLVAFEAGNPRRPYVLAGLWNGRDAPPQAMDNASDNHVKVLASRSGVRITMDDSPGAEKYRVETPGGHSIDMDDSGLSITITDSNNNTITMGSDGISISASAKVSVDAGTVEVSAGSVTVNAGMSRFNGTISCDTIIATSVVGTSYTPGAGNIW